MRRYASEGRLQRADDVEEMLEEPSEEDVLPIGSTRIHSRADPDAYGSGGQPQGVVRVGLQPRGLCLYDVEDAREMPEELSWDEIALEGSDKHTILLRCKRRQSNQK